MTVIDFVNALVVSDDTQIRLVDLSSKQVTTVSAADFALLKPDFFDLSKKNINSIFLNSNIITLSLI